MYEALNSLGSAYSPKVDIFVTPSHLLRRSPILVVAAEDSLQEHQFISWWQQPISSVCSKYSLALQHSDSSAGGKSPGWQGFQVHAENVEKLMHQVNLS